MSRQRHQLDARVLMAFFVAAMPFVAFGSFIVVNQARTLLRESVGSSLEQRAIQSGIALEQHVADQVAQLRLLAVDPDVLRALAATPALPAEGERQSLERAWFSGTDAAFAAAILDTPLAERMRILARVRPAFRQLQILDANGRLVAAASRAGRLWNGEAAWFTAAAAREGLAEARVGEPFRQEGSTVALYEIGYPVHDGRGTFRGVVRATVDASDLYSVLGPVRIGRTGHAVLLRASDGMVLASDESDRVLTAPLPGYDLIRSAKDGFQLGDSGRALFGSGGRRRGYWTLPEVRLQKTADGPAVIEPARLVGFAPVDQVPGVEWLITVEEDLGEALAPVDGVTRYLWVHFVGVFATVILLAVYVSFKLRSPVMEDDLHLHEQHVPRGVTGATS